MRITRTIFGALLAAGSIATASAAAQTDDNSGKMFMVNLTGAAEVPGPGDPDGAGTAKITIRQERNQLCFQLTVSNIAPATAAHIHEGAVGVAGPVRVPLKAPTDGSSDGCVTVARATLTAILANPANYYVNVHNAEFPAGAVRGQLA